LKLLCSKKNQWKDSKGKKRTQPPDNDNNSYILLLFRRRSKCVARAVFGGGYNLEKPGLKESASRGPPNHIKAIATQARAIHLMMNLFRRNEGHLVRQEKRPALEDKRRWMANYAVLVVTPGESVQVSRQMKYKNIQAPLYDAHHFSLPHPEICPVGLVSVLDYFRQHEHWSDTK
jgi:hypothetical protein